MRSVKQIFEDDIKCIILRRDFIKISPQGFTINRAGEKLFHINILFPFISLYLCISIRSERKLRAIVVFTHHVRVQ